jgi:hypothetical protein
MYSMPYYPMLPLLFLFLVFRFTMLPLFLLWAEVILHFFFWHQYQIGINGLWNTNVIFHPDFFFSFLNPTILSHKFASQKNSENYQ